ncbi:MAG: NADP-dependent malic enzyme [Acidobacteria bacterium]|nr:NADP-dependent malic enzyme [Acidobacteriota bacterium]
MYSEHDQKALRYHEEGRPGKIEVVPTKPCDTAKDLSLAYTPGVAAPCRAIEADAAESYRYTNRGNLVAVVTNGTAVLGLGNIGALAGKPVMEGKGVLFKKFADIDVFDIEINEKDPNRLVEIVKALEPTFGGINLEDIKAPDCFVVEQRLREEMNIPVFHDDQHGTAIIVGAACLNALVVAEKDISAVKLVVSGAGAAAIACTDMLVSLGLNPANVVMFDSKGALTTHRSDITDPNKQRYSVSRQVSSLADAMAGADVFLGLSVKGQVNGAMIASMATNPIVLALANPDPEISYEEAVAARTDVIMATGRSDYPNQVNNVLGFPYIFRGALDVRATTINEAMKHAAIRALAELAQEPVPEFVARAYQNRKFEFGREYLIPKPLDARVLLYVAPAVAEAAIESGVAQKSDFDREVYVHQLAQLLDDSRAALHSVVLKARSNPQRIAYADGHDPKVAQVVKRILEDNIAKPILVGPAEPIKINLARLRVDASRVEIVDPSLDDRLENFANILWRKRQRKGLTLIDARQQVRRSDYFAALMVHEGFADGMINGFATTYPRAARSLLQVLRHDNAQGLVVGLYIMAIKQRLLFLADTTMTEDPTPDQLATIAIETADFARQFLEPKIAMLSYSTYGSAPSPLVSRVQQATSLVRRRRPDLEIDGELQPDVALDPIMREHQYPFSSLQGSANVLIFPDLQSGNIAHKLLLELSNAAFIGPIMVGMAYPANAIQRHASVESVVGLTALTCVEAQRKKEVGR